MKVPGAAGRRGGRTKADWATTRRTLPQAGALYHGPVSHKGGPQPILLSPSGPPLSHPTKNVDHFFNFLLLHWDKHTHWGKKDCGRPQGWQPQGGLGQRHPLPGVDAFSQGSVLQGRWPQFLSCFVRSGPVRGSLILLLS